MARQKRVSFTELLDDDIIGLSEGAALQDFLAAHALRMGKRLRVQLRSFEGICRMVEGRVGIAVIPGSAARRLRRITAISIVPLDDPWALRHLEICVRMLSDLPQHARRLVEHLRSGGPAAPDDLPAVRSGL